MSDFKFCVFLGVYKFWLVEILLDSIDDVVNFIIFF